MMGDGDDDDDHRCHCCHLFVTVDCREMTVPVALGKASATG